MSRMATKIETDRLQNEKDLERPSEASERDFSRLYSSQAALVRSVIFQIAGPDSLDDLVQESFVKIWRSLSDFRSEAKISSWVYRVATNTALDHLRKGARREIATDRIDLGSIDSAAKSTSDRDLVSKGLSTLSDDHRTVLVLALMHDLPLAEIAEILQINEGTVKSRLHYAKAEFRAYLESQGAKP